MDAPHLLIHSAVDGHLGGFCILAVGNDVTLLNVDSYKRIKVSKVTKRQLLGLVAF